MCWWWDRRSPQSPEQPGWSHQSCSCPGQSCPAQPVCCPSLTHGLCPSSFPDIQPQSEPLVPLPRAAGPPMGIGASSQPLFLHPLLPLPPSVPPSPSSPPWNSRKSHFNLSGLTWQPQPGQEKPRGSSSSSGQPLQALPRLRMSSSHIPASGLAILRDGAAGASRGL